ncbi:MAG: response regulator [Flavobacteriales bacterium]|jgi:CheY-like chemotaxis protein
MMNRKQNRILLIDDDEPTNFMSKIIIQKADENSIPSVMQNPKSALNILKNESINIEEIPDLIFLDINMPSMNGWDFLDEYKDLEIHKRKNILLYMLTTSMNDDDDVKSKEYSCVNGFMVKPLTVKSYSQIVNKHFK